MKDKWLRVSTTVGHEKTFPTPCEFCGTDMILRYSEIALKKAKNERGYDPRYNAIEYKCWTCGNTVVFCIHDDKEYLEELLNRRNGVPLYYPPVSQWASEDEEIAKKLEALGYL